MVKSGDKVMFDTRIHWHCVTDRCGSVVAFWVSASSVAPGRGRSALEAGLMDAARGLGWRFIEKGFRGTTGGYTECLCPGCASRVESNDGGGDAE